MLRVLLILVLGIAADPAFAAGGENCGKLEADTQSGRLVSHPKFNKCPYATNMTCVYKLDANPLDKRSRLEFSFDEYEMPKGNKPCSGSYLKFYPDKEGKQPPFRDICDGRQLPKPFKSTTNEVRLVFKTKEFAARGFVLKWKMFRGCYPSDFKCKDGYCIEPDARCDGGTGGVMDCPDKSDEQGCIPLTSCNNTGELMCDHKLRCYPKKERCNGKIFCRDGSDESGCRVAVCKSDELPCAHKFSCFAKSFQCDSFEDCNDGSDEQDCKEATCNAGQFRCDHKLQCVDIANLCNSKSDCRDASDEIGCTPCANKDDFRCSKEKCVAKESRCNNLDDCGNGADEFGCASSCKATEFKCGFPRCVNESKLCNMVDDCGDNTDEKGCPHTLPGVGKLPCKANQVFCRTHKSCIKSSLACNGVDDCGDNSDEENCSRDLCTSKWHQCSNSQYIAKAKLCDGTPHCADKSDEKGCSPSR